MADASQATIKFIAGRGSQMYCTADWDISSVVYRGTKNKQKKMDELVFLLFSLVFCFTVPRECHHSYGATALSRPCCKLPGVVIWRKFDVWRNKFANKTLPWEGCFKNINFPRGNYTTDSSSTETLYCLTSVQWLGVVDKIPTFSHNLIFN